MSLYDRLRNLGRTDRLNREIERELAFHVEEKAAALRATGLSEADALREARRRVGNVDVQRERTRDADVIGWLLRDVRHAARGLRRTPVFAFVAVASLALGIGANTAIFTLIDAVVLRPLPVAAPEELVILGMSDDEAVGYFTNPLWEEVRDNQSGLSAAAAFSHTRFNTAAGGEARWVDGAWVSGDYFRVFGVRSLQRERMLATLSAVFGAVALALAMLGLYGVLSYSVARRRNEIGVRIAIGAGRGRVIRMVLGDVARVLAIGLVLGAAGAFASGRLVTSFLYGIEPGEPAVMVGAAVLALVAIAAGMIPAWRAARMDPTLALREE